MFANRIKLFKLLGFTVYLDPSWFIVAFLVSWSLAATYYPAFWPGMGTTTNWLLGVLGTLGLFISVVLHELGHSVVARRNGVNIRGITLFIFGGVAEMEDEPPSAHVELLIAVGGPLVSLVLAALFFGLALTLPWQESRALFFYLGMVNSMLLLFNLVPAFPLDGGRVLRALLWQWKGSLRWATFIASRIGLIFGAILMALGVASLFAGSTINAIWWFVLGLFLRSAAHNSYQNVVWRELLADTSVARLMNATPVTVGPQLTAGELVEDYVFRFHHKMFPVVGGEGRLYGAVNVEQVKALPREKWDTTSVAEIMEPVGADNTIAANSTAMAAIRKLTRGGRSRLLVVDGERLAGMISMRDLLSYVTLHLELEDQGPS